MKYQAQRIQDNQKFLLKLLHLRVGNYYPLRKWLGISFRGKIDEVSHLSIGYNTKYFKKGKKWYKQQTRVYQQPDLEYKLNLLLDKIPQLSFTIPALLQPSCSFLWLIGFILTTSTYQPTTADNYLGQYNHTANHGSDTFLEGQNFNGYNNRPILYFDTSDIPSGATFSQGDVALYTTAISGTNIGVMNRMTRITWTENGSTWDTYDGTNAWTTAGGDYTSTNAVTKTGISSNNTWYTWNASTLIQDCYDNQNKKVYVLIKTAENNGGGWYQFASKEYTTDTSKRPKLTVTYTVPVSANFFPFF